MDPNKGDSSFTLNDEDGLVQDEASNAQDGLIQSRNSRAEGNEAMQSETGCDLEQGGGTKSKGM